MESTALAPIGAQALTFHSIDEVMSFAKAIAQSPFVPKDFRGKPGDVMAAIVYGLELGLTPMSALQNLAVINGKVSVYGDLLLAMCIADPSTEYIDEAQPEEVAKTGVAWCEAKRKGKKMVRRTFSVEDATKAGLIGKDGPWKTYRNRMLSMRARSWTCRDAYADRLKGLIAREEAADIIDVIAEPSRHVLTSDSRQEQRSGTGEPDIHTTDTTDALEAPVTAKAEILERIKEAMKAAGLETSTLEQVGQAQFAHFGYRSWKQIKMLSVERLEQGLVSFQVAFQLGGFDACREGEVDIPFEDRSVASGDTTPPDEEAHSNLTFPLPNGGSYSLTSAEPPTPEVDDDGEVKAGWVSVLHAVAGYYGAEVMLESALKDMPAVTAGQFAELWTRLQQSGVVEPMNDDQTATGE